MAMYTHHTVTRPKFPPGSVRLGTFTLSQYLPKDDNAVQELHMTVQKVFPFLSELMTSLQRYHLHCADGWITSLGWAFHC